MTCSGKKALEKEQAEQDKWLKLRFTLEFRIINN